MSPQQPEVLRTVCSLIDLLPTVLFLLSIHAESKISIVSMKYVCCVERGVLSDLSHILQRGDKGRETERDRQTERERRNREREKEKQRETEGTGRAKGG